MNDCSADNSRSIRRWREKATKRRREAMNGIRGCTDAPTDGRTDGLRNGGTHASTQGGRDGWRRKGKIKAAWSTGREGGRKCEHSRGQANLLKPTSTPRMVSISYKSLPLDSDYFSLLTSCSAQSAARHCIYLVHLGLEATLLDDIIFPSKTRLRFTLNLLWS